jgi:hypothetical protein
MTQTLVAEDGMSLSPNGSIPLRSTNCNVRSSPRARLKKVTLAFVSNHTSSSNIVNGAKSCGRVYNVFYTELISLAMQ